MLFSHTPFYLIISILSTSPWTKAVLVYNASLTIPDPIPEYTFVLYTLVDRNTVDYSEDVDFPGSALGQCKNVVDPKAGSFAAPCLITIDYQVEGFLLARCQPKDVPGPGPGPSAGASIQIHIWFDDTRGKSVADMYVHQSNDTPQVWYGFGNEQSDSPLHTGNQTFDEPNSVILINCVNDKRSPIADY